MNINTLSNSEIRKRYNFRCIHGHNGLAHRICYETANNIKEVIGCLDIETSSLKADFGMVYTYCIKEIDGPLIKRAIDLKDLYAGILDKNLIAQFIEDAKKFDRFIVHYGGDYRFDIPFLRTRAIRWGLPFPEYGEASLSDTYAVLKAKFKFSSNRLGNVGKALGIPAKEHPLDQDTWTQMASGNPKLRTKALNYILVHNVEDVMTTEKLWKKISPYIKQSRRSI